MILYVEPNSEGRFAVSKRGVFSRKIKYGACADYVSALKLAVSLSAPGDLISTPEGWLQRHFTWRAGYEQ